MSILNRLKKNFKHRSKWAKKEKIPAYRLYERDIPDYPFIIDIYNNKAVIYHRPSKLDSEDKKLHHPSEITDSLIELGISKSNHFWKIRSPKKAATQYEKEDTSKQVLDIIEEKGQRFHVNLSDYLDTGIFLDHRPLRQRIYKEIKETQVKEFLNLFSYTCTVSVMAALAGAHCTSIDMSKTYLEWGKDNFRLNQIQFTEHDFLQQDVLNWLIDGDQQFEKKKYDLIFFDPPTFSTSKRMNSTWDVQRDHADALYMAAKMLSPNGVLYFSTNLRSFKMETKELSSLKIEDITHQSFDQDFKDHKLHQLFKIKWA